MPQDPRTQALKNLFISLYQSAPPSEQAPDPSHAYVEEFLMGVVDRLSELPGAVEVIQQCTQELTV